MTLALTVRLRRFAAGWPGSILAEALLDAASEIDKAHPPVSIPACGPDYSLPPRFMLYDRKTHRILGEYPLEGHVLCGDRINFHIVIDVGP